MTTAQPVDRVETWTATQAAEVFSSLSLASPQPASRRTVAIDIPLDDAIQQEQVARMRSEAVHTVYKRREPIRRDSLKRREALLKGKEGSRRRQRWENDRLLSNPYAEPPLPSDWEVRPTYPVQQVPYFLAPLWDAEYAKVSERRAVASSRPKLTGEAAAAHKVAQELRAKLKKARGAKGLLQDLETEVRGFVEQWDQKQRQLEAEGFIDLDDSSDEELVFVGRNAAVQSEKSAGRRQQALKRDKLVYESLVDDHGASFGRYLVHLIGQYYGLKTWSITTGNPARREAYVGFDETRNVPDMLPRPLWLVV